MTDAEMSTEATKAAFWHGVVCTLDEIIEMLEEEIEGGDAKPLPEVLSDLIAWRKEIS